MSANVGGFELTPRREKAALLVAEDQVSDTQIAAEVRIAQRTLERWKKVPEFAARVEEHRAALRAAIVAKGIADKQNRVDALDDRWHRMQRVIEARAEAHQKAPGGETGLLVRQVKFVRVHHPDGDDDDGPRYHEVEEYAVDTGLLRELRAHEEQAAKELGQWVDKQETTGEHVVRIYERGNREPGP